ncbi:MAG: metallopeptidase family protein [Oscillospiraceae bacterium]|nr:metallopeptidase family protein [Oscillospiraceae bacterium]
MAPMTFEEAAAYLDRLADELPEGIARKLNGGVNLLPDEKPGGRDGLSTLGMYFADAQMGRYIELYYGSFVKLFGHATREKFERELKRTLYHELTHHVESLAGDRTLELEDERFMEDYDALTAGEPIDVDSVLFVSFGAPELAAAAEGLFRARCREADDDIRCGSAVVTDGEIPETNQAAVRAAEALGAEMEKIRPVRVTGELLLAYDAVICMTEDEADELAERFPRCDMRIFALGDKDIAAPRTALGWGKCARSVNEGVLLLLDDLYAED